MLKYEVPVVYGLIMNMSREGVFPIPPLFLINIICKGSQDPSLLKPKFQRYLNEYAEHGIYCRRPKRMTKKRKAYYESIRKKKMQKYIDENKRKIETMKRTI